MIKIFGMKYQLLLHLLTIFLVSCSEYSANCPPFEKQIADLNAQLETAQSFSKMINLFFNLKNLYGSFQTPFDASSSDDEKSNDTSKFHPIQTIMSPLKFLPAQNLCRCQEGEDARRRQDCSP